MRLRNLSSKNLTKVERLSITVNFSTRWIVRIIDSIYLLRNSFESNGLLSMDPFYSMEYDAENLYIQQIFT